MNPFYSYDYGVRFFIVTMYFGTVVWLLYLTIRSFADDRAVPVRILNILLLALAVILDTALAQSHYYTFRTGDWGVRIPVWLLLLIVTILLIYSMAVMLYDRQTRETSITRDSIRETLDNLPAGVCYFNRDGLPCLSNRRITEIGIALTGTDFQSIDELHRIFPAEDPSIHILPDGSAWSYEETRLDINTDEWYTLSLLFDVTELNRKKQELEAQNADLRKISGQLRYLNDNAYKLAKEEEILAARTKFHDTMGAGIAAVHQMLSGEIRNTELERVIRMWYRSLGLSATGISNEADPLEDFERDAAALGVKFTLSGTFPADPEIGELFTLGLRTALTNCIRHAGASQLHAEVAESAEEVVLSITNDGKNPEHEVTEGGGITNLRDHARRMGGRVETRWKPRYVLQVAVPVSAAQPVHI